jgi:ABC-type phosphate transport system substrate-binding protein
VIPAVSSSLPRRTIQQLLLALVTLSLIAEADAQTLVVIVNPAIGVQRLSRHEVLDIFLGRYRTFPSGASALPIDLNVNSTERRQFYMLLAHKDTSDMGSYWARLTFSGKISPPFAVSDARMAIDIVANNPNAIAYVDLAEVDQRVRIALEITP